MVGVVVDVLVVPSVVVVDASMVVVVLAVVVDEDVPAADVDGEEVVLSVVVDGEPVVDGVDSVVESEAEFVVASDVDEVVGWSV